jgi:hypothetical protein
VKLYGPYAKEEEKEKYVGSMSASSQTRMTSVEIQYLSQRGHRKWTIYSSCLGPVFLILARLTLMTTSSK